MCAEVDINKNTILIANVYSPNISKEKKTFNKFMNGKLNKYKTEHKIILGDFNCVMDNNLDVISGDSHHTEDVERLKSFVYDNDFSDT